MLFIVSASIRQHFLVKQSTENRRRWSVSRQKEERLETRSASTMTSFNKLPFENSTGSSYWIIVTHSGWSHLVILGPTSLWRHSQRVGAQETPMSTVGLAKSRLHPVCTRLWMKTGHEGKKAFVEGERANSEIPEACPGQGGPRSQSHVN